MSLKFALVTTQSLTGPDVPIKVELAGRYTGGEGTVEIPWRIPFTKRYKFGFTNEAATCVHSLI
jgi:hypothetical protein